MQMKQTTGDTKNTHEPTPLCLRVLNFQVLADGGVFFPRIVELILDGGDGRLPIAPRPAHVRRGIGGIRPRCWILRDASCNGDQKADNDEVEELQMARARHL